MYLRCRLLVVEACQIRLFALQCGIHQQAMFRRSICTTFCHLQDQRRHRLHSHLFHCPVSRRQPAHIRRALATTSRLQITTFLTISPSVLLTLLTLLVLQCLTTSSPRISVLPTCAAQSLMVYVPQGLDIDKFVPRTIASPPPSQPLHPPTLLLVPHRPSSFVISPVSNSFIPLRLFRLSQLAVTIGVRLRDLGSVLMGTLVGLTALAQARTPVQTQAHDPATAHFHRPSWAELGPLCLAAQWVLTPP